MQTFLPRLVGRSSSSEDDDDDEDEESLRLSVRCAPVEVFCGKTFCSKYPGLVIFPAGS